MSDLITGGSGYRPVYTPGPIGGSARSYPSSKVPEFINNAKKFLGQWYLWGGGHSSKTGLQRVDCSGLVTQAARLSGINLDGTAATQQAMSRPVSMKDLQPGDLVFHGRPAEHVGIYIGNNKVIHSSHTGAQCQIVDLSTYHYFDNAGRVFSGNAVAPPPSNPPATGQATVKKGSHGPAVTTLQQKLKAHGVDPGPIDGDFGPKTDAAVRAFQRAKGLSVDGVVGPKTWAALNQPVSQPKPPAPKPPAPKPPTPVPKPPTPTPAPPPTSYVVQPGDTLFSIAKKTLGDSNRWYEIYQLNQATIGTSSYLVYPGMTLKLPTGTPSPQPKLPGFLDTPIRVDFQHLFGWLGSLPSKLSSIMQGMRPPG